MFVFLLSCGMLIIFCFVCCFLLYNILCIVIYCNRSMGMCYGYIFWIFWSWSVCILVVWVISVIVIYWVYLFIFILYSFGLLMVCSGVCGIVRGIFGFVIFWICCVLCCGIFWVGRFVWFVWILLRGLV